MALAVVATVICALPEPVREAWSKLTVTPEGAPLADSATAPVNPPEAPTLTEACAELPAVTLAEPGLAVRLKSGLLAALTVSETVALWLRLPLEPVMVSVEVPDAAAVVLIDNVAEPLPVTGPEKVPLTPEGALESEKL